MTQENRWIDSKVLEWFVFFIGVKKREADSAYCNSFNDAALLIFTISITLYKWFRAYSAFWNESVHKINSWLTFYIKENWSLFFSLDTGFIWPLFIMFWSYTFTHCFLIHCSYSEFSIKKTNLNYSKGNFYLYSVLFYCSTYNSFNNGACHKAS